MNTLTETTTATWKEHLGESLLAKLPPPPPAAWHLRTGLKDSLGQNWTKLSPTTWADQFGFVIEQDSTQEKPFILFHQGERQARCYTIETAKTYSSIFMNDIIVNKQLQR